MPFQGKNISTREIFEGGIEDEKGQLRRKEQIKIEGQIDAKNLRERFEKGLSVVESDSEESGDRKEVDRVFKDAGLCAVCGSFKTSLIHP